MTWPETVTQLGSTSTSGLIFYTLVTLVFCVVIQFVYKRHKKFAIIDKIPGPRAYPIVGNGIEISRGPHEFFRLVTGKYSKYPGGLSRIWIGSVPFVLIYNENGTEKILSSSKYIDKSEDYTALEPWLGTGLLTSAGKKWKTRRKFLTPTFHFSILEDFLEIFNRQALKFVSKLEPHENGKPFNIFNPIGLCALDIILETAMGTRLNAQDNAESDYVNAVHRMGRIILAKQTTPWIRPQFLFKLLGYKKQQDECLKVLHGLSLETIRQRRKEYRENKMKKLSNTKKEDSDIGKRRRLAMLDLLLEYSEENDDLSDEDIREEVDTFIFEGHDTTAAGFTWAIYLLGSYPEIQEKVYEELVAIFGDSNRQATTDDIREMKYLECCIKEALRIFPSVPYIARELKEDTEINGYTIPSGTTLLLVNYRLHRDPKHFPDPEEFQPERFFPENAAKRHPYAYAPFSAGPRNCIGQKFAMMEEKAVLSTFFRKYRVESMTRRKDMKPTADLILRPEHGTIVKLFPRNN